MNDYTKPRRPLVPGPGMRTGDPALGGSGGGGIAAKAIAVREDRTRLGMTMGDQPATLVGVAGMPSQGKPLGGEVFSRHSGPTGKIIGAIANVMKEVGTIQMTGYNAFHRYKYPKLEDILPVITPLMGEYGLVIHQNEIEIKNIEGNRIAVAYEFTVYHESGESLPPARHTGMAIARDTKGNWDDKAVAKCHTNARKFHMQALFEIPLEVPDSEDANQRQERRPVPGPKEGNLAERPAAGGGRLTNLTSEEAIKEGVPHRIALGQGAGADQWAGAYLRAIAGATTLELLQAWDNENDTILQSLSDKYPDTYEQIAAAFERRQAQLGGEKTWGLPDPKVDPQESMNWIAGQLQNLKTYEAAETFWNQVVAPREGEFLVDDWEMLMKEWQRTEARLNPPDDAAE